MELPISPNFGQKNMDNLSNTLSEQVLINMGVLNDTGPEGRNFLDNDHNLFGYDGVVVNEGKIISLINLDKDESIPSIHLNGEVPIKGDSDGYISSGHKPGDRVKVIGFIEPFFESETGRRSSDKIIKVEGNGAIGWIKPSEIDKQLLLKQRETETQQLFDPTNK
jgi:hypothetical protein